MLKRVWGKGNPPTLLVGMQIGITTMENSMVVPQKTKNRIAIWSNNPTPGYVCIFIFTHTHIYKQFKKIHVHNRTIYNSQDMETTWMSMDRWMDKEDVVHIYGGILLSHKKEWNTAICGNMDGPIDYHTEWSQKKTYHMISLICGI